MTSDRKQTLVVIVGPTGSGKTAVAVQLAQRLGAPILSTDSRQVFRGMAIGTAQPTAEELAAATHYFIADREVSDDYNAGRFEVEALALLEQLFGSHDYVIAVGGSGLYVDALCNGFDPLPQADPELRRTLEERLQREGLPALAAELERLDPAYWAEVDRCNPARVLRALEVCLLTGQPYSAQRKGVQRERPFRIVKIGIDVPREELYDRINRRVDDMMRAGLLAEAERLYPLRHLNTLRTVGYQELFTFFDGDCSLEEAVDLIKRNSRRYAKRQMTWFRRDEAIRWFDRKEIEMMKKYCEKFAEN